MSTSRDEAACQLENYKKSSVKPDNATTSFGVPIDNKSTSLTAGPKGPILLQDVVLIDELSHFDREKIPERPVHAKGAGASGYFEVTNDISMFTKACVFSHVGKRTELMARFSTTAGETGSSDTIRNVRGFSVKFYTEDGIWDVVGNNSPVFFIRDPLLFPSLIHAQKRNPVTFLKDQDMYWDYLSLLPESTHQVLLLFTDRGIPDGYRHMNGYGSHTFKLVNANNETFWCKFHFKTNQGIKNLPTDKAAMLAGTDPDYGIRDLYNSIEKGDFPSWDLSIQIMTVEQAKQFKYDIFDVTKVWSQSEFPLIPVGKMVLNKNPENYHTDVEQAAFAPSHLIPGIEPSPDRILQGRLFAYNDAQRYRLGVNALQLPVNCPLRATAVRNHQRDGAANFGGQGGAPNYFPNSFNGPIVNQRAKLSSFEVEKDVDRHTRQVDYKLDFEQPGVFWRKVLNHDERTRVVNNLVGSLKPALKFIQERAVENFSKVDEELGSRLRDALQLKKCEKAHL